MESVGLRSALSLPTLPIHDMLLRVRIHHMGKQEGRDGLIAELSFDLGNETIGRGVVEWLQAVLVKYEEQSNGQGQRLGLHDDHGQVAGQGLLESMQAVDCPSWLCPSVQETRCCLDIEVSIWNHWQVP